MCGCVSGVDCFRLAGLRDVRVVARADAQQGVGHMTWGKRVCVGVSAGYMYIHVGVGERAVPLHHV